MSDRDGLNPREFEDLIRRLSQRKQEHPSEKIPFQDVKDILQDEGLLESLLKEHVSSRNQALEESEQRRKKQFSFLFKGFGVLSLLLTGVSLWGGYKIANTWLADSASRASTDAQNTLTTQNQTLVAKVADLEGQIKTKDEQIKDLISKTGTVAATPTAPAPSGNSDPNTPLAVVGGGSNNSNSPVDLGTLNVSLQDCTRSTKSSKMVKCSLSLVSKTDQTVGVGSCSSDTRTRVFDPQGVAYKADSVEFGNNTNSAGCTVETALIKDVPARATLTFKDVPLELKNFKALEASVQAKGEKEMEWQYPQYREITIR